MARRTSCRGSGRTLTRQKQLRISVAMALLLTSCAGGESGEGRSSDRSDEAGDAFVDVQRVWVGEQLSADGRGAMLNAIASSGPNLLAVGTDLHEAACPALLLIGSRDGGSTWTDESPTDGRCRWGEDVTVGRSGEFVVAGTIRGGVDCEGQPTSAVDLWRGKPGSQWKESVVSGLPMTCGYKFDLQADVANDGDNLFLINRFTGGARLYEIIESRAEMLTEIPGSEEIVSPALQRLADGTLAITHGLLCCASEPVAWSSRDGGNTWTKHELPGGVPGEYAVTDVVRVSGDAQLFVGYEQEGGSALWRTQSWAERLTEIEIDPQSEVERWTEVEVDEAGQILSVGISFGAGGLAIAVSRDGGNSWEAQPFPYSSDDISRVEPNDLLYFDGGFFAVGDESVYGGAEDTVPMIWRLSVK